MKGFSLLVIFAHPDGESMPLAGRWRGSHVESRRAGKLRPFVVHPARSVLARGYGADVGGNSERRGMETITVKPYIIARRCPAQEDVCKVIAACPQGAITYVKDEGEPLGGKIVFDYDKCDGCGLCVTECCGAAVEMK